MFSKIPQMSRFITAARPTNLRPSIQAHNQVRAFIASARLATIVDSHFISQITAAEKVITNSDEPAKGGPTAQAQSHAGQKLTAQVIHDITMGERRITGTDKPVQNGPTSIAQSILSSSSAIGGEQHTGRLDSSTMGKITAKEKEITGEAGPVKQGPTAKAQQHAGEPITSEALHDITEGEKKITGGERVKGGPTSAAQSELSKSRS